MQARRRRRRRRSAVARPDHADRRPHEACRRPPAAAADDGGDGAAGLRPVRLQLPRLFGSDREQERSAAQPLRPRRQGNRADAEVALRGDRQGAGRAVIGACSGAGCAAPAVVAEPGRSRDNPVAATFLSRRLLNKQGLGKGNLAHRVRSRPAAGSTMSSAIPSASSPATISAWSTRSSRCSAPPTPRRSTARRCAKSCSTTSRCRRRRTRCSS